MGPQVTETEAKFWEESAAYRRALRSSQPPPVGRRLCLVRGILRNTGDPINRPHPDSFIRQSSHARRCKLERPEATASPLSTEHPTPKAQMTLREKRAIVPAPSFRALAQRSCPRRETDYKRKTSETCLERTKFTCNTAWRLVDSSELGGEP